MKIKKLHINAFGRLSNFDLDLSQGVNTICQKNGYGKTTLAVFLRAMFYGLAKRGNNKAYVALRSKYMPWDGGSYGGWLVFEANNKTYRLIRTFGQTPEGDTFQLLDEDTGLISQDFTKDVGSQLFGCSEDTFLLTAFFAQEGLMGDVNDEVRASLTGSNKFEYDLAQCSKAEGIIANQIKLARSNMPKQTEIEQLNRQIKETESLQNLNENNLKTLQKDIKNIENQLFDAQKQNDAAKKEYVDALSAQNKLNFLQQQKQDTLVQIERLQQDAVLPKQETLTPSKDAKAALLLPALMLSLIAGVALIIASLFVANKAALLTVGVVLSVAAVVLFGFMLIKRIGRAEKLSQQNQQKVAEAAKLAATQQQLERLNQSLQSILQQIETLRAIKPAQQIEEKLSRAASLDKQLSLLKAQKESLTRSLQEGQQQLDQQMEQLQNLLEKRATLTEKLNLLNKTKQLLSVAKDNVSQRYLQPMQSAFDQIYKLFGAEQQLGLDINLQVNQITDYGVKESGYLSQGLQDLLSICRRFALLDKVYQKEKPFLVLDDPFVNLDDKNLAQVKTIVCEFAKKYQIIYMCAHSKNKI